MFAMLRGPWPRLTPDGERLVAIETEVAAGRLDAAALDDAIEHAVDAAIGAQVDAGLALLTDGQVRWADPAAALLAAIRDADLGPTGLLVRAWRSAARRTILPVAQAMTGPWTLAAGALGSDATGDAVAGLAIELAEALAGELAALAEAGCPLVQVLEPWAIAIGVDARARDGFRAAHARLVRDAGDLHAMLAITGGSASDAGADTILAAPYASYLFDLAAGADNWHLVRAVPGDRGVVCAALRAGDGRERLDQAPELVWAAHYAASANGRGLDRVGLTNASPLDSLGIDEARAALAALANAARLATLPAEDAIRAGLDPRSVARGD